MYLITVYPGKAGDIYADRGGADGRREGEKAPVAARKCRGGREVGLQVLCRDGWG